MSEGGLILYEMYLLQVCTSASKFALLMYGILGVFALAGVVAGVASFGLGIYSVLRAFPCHQNKKLLQCCVNETGPRAGI